MSVDLEITTSSQVMNYNPQQQSKPPQITLNGNAVPTPGSTSQTGWQLVIFDATKDITKPDSILVNQMIYLRASNANSWMGSYQWMYSQMVRTILNAGNINTQTIVLASYGLDANTPPSSDALWMLLEAGAGSQLQYWETHCDVGSQVGNSTSWTSFPANYIFVGASAWGYGQGFEKFERPASGSSSVTSTLSVTLG